MDRPGEQLLAGPRLPEDEHGGVRRRDLAHLGQDVEQRGAVSQDLSGPADVPQLVAQELGLAGQRGDAPLCLQPLVDVAEDEREVPVPVELEERERGLDREGASARGPAGEASRDPGTPAGTVLGLAAQRLQPSGVLRAHQGRQRHARGLLLGDLEGALGGRVHPGDPQLPVELDDRVQRARDQAGQLRLACPDLPLDAQAPQLCRRASGEDLEHRPTGRVIGHRHHVEHRQVAEHASVQVHERHAHVADGARSAQAGIVRIQIDDAIRVVHQAAVLHHHLTGSAVHRLLPVLDPLPAEEERQCPQPPSLRIELRHPGPARSQRAGQVLDQRSKEPLADLAGRSLEDPREGGLRRRVQALAGRRQHGCILTRAGSSGPPPVPDVYFFLQLSSPSFCQAPGLLSTSVVTVTWVGLFRVTVVRVLVG